MKNILLILTPLILLLSCSEEKKTEQVIQKTEDFTLAPPLQVFLPVLGVWENKTDSSLLAEHWSILNDSTIKGFNFYVLKKDTNFKEVAYISIKSDSVFYLVTVEGQNENKEIPFKLTKRFGQHFTFENPTHDFPKMIEYDLLHKDTLLTRISGSDNNEYGAQEHFYIRSK